MELFITPTGKVVCLYGEALDLNTFGPMAIRRASRVEPDALGQWTADLLAVAGPILGPFRVRSEALVAEALWIKTHCFMDVD